MAWQINHLLYETDGTSAQSHTSSSFTPTANAVLCVFYGGFLTSESDTIAWAISDSESLSWTQQDRTGAGNTSTSGGQTEGIFWYADVGASPASMTITVEMHATTTHEHGFMVFEIEDGDTSAPFDQFAISVDQNPSADPFTTDTLGSTPSSGLLAAGFLQQRASSGTRTWDSDPTNWTTLSTPPTGTWIDPALLTNTSTNDTSVSHGVGGTASLQNTMMFIAEIAASAGITITADLPSETDTALEATLTPTGTATVTGDLPSETDTALEPSITIGTAIWDGLADDTLGGTDDGTLERLSGDILWTQVRDGIDGSVVWSVDARQANIGDTSLTDVLGNTFNLNGGTQIVNHDSYVETTTTPIARKTNVISYDDDGVDRPITGLLGIGAGEGEDQIKVYKQSTLNTLPLWEDKLTYTDQDSSEIIEKRVDLKLAAESEQARRLTLEIHPEFDIDVEVGEYARVVIEDSLIRIDSAIFWVGSKKLVLSKQQDEHVTLEVTE